MKVRLSRHSRQIALYSLATFGLLAIAPADRPLRADEQTGKATAAEYVGDLPSSCTFEFEMTEAEDPSQWCGWGTHDSVPLSRPRPRSRTSSNFDQSLAAAASAACASVGVSVEQIVEPFAMVGPTVADSIERVQQFQRWWNQTLAAAESIASDLAATGPLTELALDEVAAEADVPPLQPDPWKAFGESIVVADSLREPPVDCRLEQLSLEEPIDVARFGPSILTAADSAVAETIEPTDVTNANIEAVEGRGRQVQTQIPTPRIAGAATSQMGASAVIVSFEDGYLAYDVSARDLKVWSVFPLVTQPFCIRSHREAILGCHPWGEADMAAAATQMTVPSVETAISETDGKEPRIDQVAATPTIHAMLGLQGSLECLVDEWIWKATTTANKNYTVAEWIRPKSIGRQVAVFAIQASEAADTATERVASLWPETEPQPPQTAGEKLLVRAGAIEAAELPVDRSTAPLIAEAPATTLR